MDRKDNYYWRRLDENFCYIRSGERVCIPIHSGGDEEYEVVNNHKDRILMHSDFEVKFLPVEFVE